MNDERLAAPEKARRRARATPRGRRRRSGPADCRDLGAAVKAWLEGHEDREGWPLRDEMLPRLLAEVPSALESPRVRMRLSRLRAPDFVARAANAPALKRSRAAERLDLARRSLLKRIGDAIANPVPVSKEAREAKILRTMALSAKLARRMSAEDYARGLRARNERLVGQPGPVDSALFFFELQLAERILRILRKYRSLTHDKEPSKRDEWLQVLAVLDGEDSGGAVRRAFFREKKLRTGGRRGSATPEK